MCFDVRLDLLEVKNCGNCPPVLPFCDLLNLMHETGFYKRLHFCMKHMREFENELASLVALEKLQVSKYIKRSLPNLKKMDVHNYSNIVHIPNFMNLERLSTPIAQHKEILHLIQRLPKLKTLIVYKAPKQFHIEILNLCTLNKERKMLCGARKVVIYVPSDLFLRTKWNTVDGDTNFDTVEMRQLDSYDKWKEYDCVWFFWIKINSIKLYCTGVFKFFIRLNKRVNNDNSVRFLYFDPNWWLTILLFWFCCIF